MHELDLIRIGQFAARLAGGYRDGGQHHQLTRERLGRGDADFRSGQGRQHGLAFARDGRGRHVDHRKRVQALRLRIAQRRQRIGGLAGLRNEDRQIAFAQRRFAVAEFGSHIEFDRHTAQPFEPVFTDIAGIARGAAGDDRNPLDILEIERQFERQRDAFGRHVDVARQRVADDFRLLVNFLGHEVAIIGLVDQERRRAGFQHVAVHYRALRVIDHADFAGQNHPVAVLEITDGVGKGRQRNRVRAQIHLAVAMADRQRRTLAGADQEIAMALEQEHQREGAAQLRQRCLHRFLRRGAFEQIGIDQMRHHFGVGLAQEFGALLFQHVPQLAEILDDAVVNHRDVFGRVRMRVVFVWLAVRGPAGMSDAGVTGERFGFQSQFEIPQFALGAAARRDGRLPAWRRQRNRSRDIRGA